MAQENNINDLLSGFLSGKLTSKEKSDLYHYMTNEGHSEEILAWLQAQWAEGLWQTGGEISSEAMLTRIKAEIENQSITGSQQQTGRKIPINQKTTIKFIRIFLRYAAVLLFVLGSSWAIWKVVKTPSDKDVVAEIALQYNEIAVPYGSKTKVILSDSSTVWLNAGARLKYPVVFNSNQRHVYLDGEGFFEVVANRQHPFVVHSDKLTVTVLGTKFNVMANSDDAVIETTLVEGAIEIWWLKNETDKQSNISLKPGQKLTLSKENEQYAFQNIQEAGFSIAWMENRLVFDKERFGDVKIKLERWYGIAIEVKNLEILDYLITGTFENQTLEQAMEALSIAISCTYTIDNNKMIVSL